MHGDINLGHSVRDEVLHQSIDSSPEVDIASSVCLRVVGILLALEQILYEELGLPWNYDQRYFFISIYFFSRNNKFQLHLPPTTYPDIFLLSAPAFLEGQGEFLFVLRLYGAQSVQRIKFL